MAAISTWSKTAADNNSAIPDGAPEGWKPSEVNAWGREAMAAVRVWYEDPDDSAPTSDNDGGAEWSNFGHTLTWISGSSFSTAVADGDTTGIYQVDRRYRIVAAFSTAAFGRITASSFNGSITTVTIVGGALDNPITGFQVGRHSPDNPSIDGAAISRGNELAGYEAGTLMLFVQTTAPLFWTKQTTHNNKGLRLVTGSASSGGTESFFTVFSSAQFTDSYAIQIADMPAHTHTSPWVTGGPVEDGGGSAASIPQSGTGPAMGSAGGGFGHQHTLSMDLQYVDVIIAAKV